MTFQSGIVPKYVVGGSVTSFLFGDTQISVDSSNGLPTIVKLQPIDPSQGKSSVFVQDDGNNCSVGNITIVASNGNLINGSPTLVLDTDGIGVEIAITDQNNFIGNLSTDTPTSGITNANNGLTLSGSTVQFGGNLIVPTVLDALGVNTFSINDQVGLFMQTRDVNGNFFFNNIGGAGTLVGSVNYVFSYLGDVGNIFENTTVVVNFGGANYIKGGNDFWNFGDYTVADNNSSIFNFGRFNNIANSSLVLVNGNQNTISNAVFSNIIGFGNFVSATTSSTVIGQSNFLDSANNSYAFGESINYKGNGGYFVGRNINIDNAIGDIYGFGLQLNITGGAFVDAVVSVGFVNTINATSQTRGVYMFGDSISCNDFVTYSTLIGESCSMTRADHCFAFGIFNDYVDVRYIYSVGEDNDATNSISNAILGLNNDFNTVNNGVFLSQNGVYTLSDNLSVVGIGNIVDSTNTLSLLGISNNVNQSGNISVFGYNNTVDLSNDLTVVGLGNNLSAYANSTLVGQNNFGIKLDDSVMNIGAFGGTPLVSFDYSATPSIVVNVPISPVGLPSKALWDNLGVINITP